MESSFLELVYRCLSPFEYAIDFDVVIGCFNVLPHHCVGFVPL